jgi:ABC-type polysaccharide/polyol phosphate transport system ATPase subunit
VTTRPPAIVASDVAVDYDVRLTADRTLRRTTAELLRERGRKRASLCALRDVSFTVRDGDVVGVVGSNGAGKSTLLLSIAGVLRPTRGAIYTFGRKATLLSLGTAFEPDLTGRQNIELTAAYLGLSKRILSERVTEIIAFSEVGAFIDAPLRTFSTGMRTRLAFSIAAHVEPEILLLDELLAVGDASFQRKSQAKLRELMRKASAIMVVTHALDWVRATCTRALWLDHGRLVRMGEPGDVVAEYLAHVERERAAAVPRPGVSDPILEDDPVETAEPSVSPYSPPDRMHADTRSLWRR